MGSVIFFFSRKRGILGCDWASSSETARNDTSLSLYWAASLESMGISSRHGRHQVAQKLRTTILPRETARVCGLPERSLKERGGGRSSRAASGGGGGAAGRRACGATAGV